MKGEGMDKVREALPELPASQAFSLTRSIYTADDMHAYARAALASQAEKHAAELAKLRQGEARAVRDAALSGPAPSVPAVPIPLNIIRKWPEGFQDRLQHVWLDVVSFIPEVKLRDLQSVLAEFGFRMEVYEAAAPHPAAKGAES